MSPLMQTAPEVDQAGSREYRDTLRRIRSLAGEIILNPDPAAARAKAIEIRKLTKKSLQEGR